jgi:hypothetical protein
MGEGADRSDHRERHLGRLIAAAHDDEADVIESLGWVATTLVVGSYFSARAERLRLLQMLGAALWMIYGLLIGASPVVVANVLVFAAAAWTTWRARRVPRPDAG